MANDTHGFYMGDDKYIVGDNNSFISKNGTKFFPSAQGILAPYFKNYGKTLKFFTEEMFYNIDSTNFETVEKALDTSITAKIIGFYCAQSWERMQFSLTFTAGSGFTDGQWKAVDHGTKVPFYIVDRTETYNTDPSWSSSGLGDDSWEGDINYPVMVRINTTGTAVID